MPEVVFRVAREFDFVAVRISDDVQASVEKLLLEGRCLGCKKKLLPGKKVTRGQCSACTSATHRALHNKKITVNELMRKGKLLKEGRPGPKPKNDYAKEMAEL